jgi:hypothetical protein
MASLFKSLPETSLDKKLSPRSRLIAKFIDNNHEKVDRLVEMIRNYYQKCQSVDAELSNENSDLLDAEEIYLRRLNNGLFTLQMLCLVFAYLVREDLAVTLYSLTLVPGTCQDASEQKQPELPRHQKSPRGIPEESRRPSNSKCRRKSVCWAGEAGGGMAYCFFRYKLIIFSSFSSWISPLLHDHSHATFSYRFRISSASSSPFLALNCYEGNQLADILF